MSFDRAALDFRHDLIDGFADAWAHLASPGARWTGEQRVQIAAEARRARANLAPGSGLDPPVTEAARKVSADPASIRRAWILRLQAEGLDAFSYVELIGVVSRVVAIDTFFEALGLPHEPLPEPEPGPQTGATARNARLGRAWVPMVGGTSITQALSLVPGENGALERLHGPMYISFDRMSEHDFSRALTRPQMELVASRTSAVNECFY